MPTTKKFFSQNSSPELQNGHICGQVTSRLSPLQQPQDELENLSHEEPNHDSTLLRSEWPFLLLLLVLGLISFGTTLILTQDIPLWMDESMTWWTVGVVQDGELFLSDLEMHPPFYYVMVALTTSVFGTTELGMRTLSTLAAALAVPMFYSLTRNFADRTAAVLVALFVISSPLMHFYASEARSYTLMVLLILGTVHVYFRFLDQPTRPANWIVLTLTLAVLLNTHPAGVFFLPFVALFPLLCGGWAGLRPALLITAAGVCAFATHLPWFLGALNQESTIGWLEVVWNSGNRWLLIPQSIAAFGFSANYDFHLRRLSEATSMPVLSGILVVALLVLATVKWNDQFHGCLSTRDIKLFLWGSMLTMLLIQWGYSWLRTPFYLVGKYDMLALPYCLILFGLGAAKLLRKPSLRFVGVPLIMLIGVTSFVTINTTILRGNEAAQRIYIPRDVMKLLAKEAREGDTLVCLGMSYNQVGYYRHRYDVPIELISFPADFIKDFGYYDRERYLSQLDTLKSEAVELTKQLAKKADQGHEVWILETTRVPEVDEVLLKELHNKFTIDESQRHPRLRLKRLE